MLFLNERELEILLKITESLEATMPLLCSLMSTFKSVQMCQGLKPKYQTMNPTNGGVYCNGMNTRDPQTPNRGPTRVSRDPHLPHVGFAC